MKTATIIIICILLLACMLLGACAMLGFGTATMM